MEGHPIGEYPLCSSMDDASQALFEGRPNFDDAPTMHDGPVVSGTGALVVEFCISTAEVPFSVVFCHASPPLPQGGHSFFISGLGYGRPVIGPQGYSSGYIVNHLCPHLEQVRLRLSHLVSIHGSRHLFHFAGSFFEVLMFPPRGVLLR